MNPETIIMANNPIRPRGYYLLPLALVALAVACSHVAGKGDGGDWSDARQLMLVTTADWNATQGTLRTYVRNESGWQPVGDAAAVTIGRSGSAWGLGLQPVQPGADKHEGDGRAPAGVFHIGTAFGYADSASTALAYAAMSESHYCVDVSGSPLYNRIVDAREVGAAAVAGSTEPMRRDIHANGDQRYKLGFVIEHNPDGRAGAGSCIFAHVWNAAGEPTSGCTAMAEPVLQRLLAWLRPEQHPIYVLLPESEYARLHAQWQLPELTSH